MANQNIPKLNKTFGKRALGGGLTGLLQNVLAMGTQLVLAPVILVKAGQEVMGAYAILMQAVGYSLLLDFGVSLALTRFLATAGHLETGSGRFAALFLTGR